MAERLTKRTGDIFRSFITQDGSHFRRTHQELGPAMRRAELIREAGEEANRRGINPTGRTYLGSIPMAVLINWLQERGYTMHDWAVNAGGTKCPPGADPVAHAATDGGVKSEFMRFFLTRDWCKLHSQHITTKRERSSVFMGEAVKNGNKQLLGAQGSNS